MCEMFPDLGAPVPPGKMVILDEGPTPVPEGFWDNAEIISRYTREQALEDGVLIDVTELAKEAGIKFPVAFTAGLWHDVAENIPERLQGIADWKGRAWDVFSVFRWHAKSTPGDALFFTISMPLADTKGVDYHIKSVIGPGDDPRPVITMMRPEED